MTYLEYVKKQSQINQSKFGLTSLTLDEVAQISRCYREHAGDPRGRDEFFAICQGVRNGAEVRAFSRRLGRRLFGTDISKTVLQLTGTISVSPA